VGIEFRSGVWQVRVSSERTVTGVSNKLNQHVGELSRFKNRTPFSVINFCSALSTSSVKVEEYPPLISTEETIGFYFILSEWVVVAASRVIPEFRDIWTVIYEFSNTDSVRRHSAFVLEWYRAGTIIVLTP